jgi:hypothetical protein
MLYSYNSQYPKPLPFRIKLSDGRTRTDPSTFTEEEITDAGYVLVANKPTITETQIVNWNSETLSWDVRDKTEQEIYSEWVLTVPRSVTMRQARLALFRAGLLEQVDSAIQAQAESTAKIEWEYAQTVDLNSDLVQGLSQQLQLTEQQLYDLFITASQL